jgi:hypothetical protein
VQVVSFFSFFLIFFLLLIFSSDEIQRDRRESEIEREIRESVIERVREMRLGRERGEAREPEGAGGGTGVP